MRRQTIAVDIDDVLAAHVPAFVDYSNRTWGTDLTVGDYTEDWPTLWRVDFEEAEKRSVQYHESGHIDSYDWLEDAQAVLGGLAKRFRIIVVTSRRSTVHQSTLEWIEAHFPNIFDGVHFAGFWDLGPDSHKLTKAAICRELGADYLIDDQLKHCVAAAECGIPSLLFGEYHWNKEDNLPEKVYRVADWLAVEEFMNEAPHDHTDKYKKEL